MQRGEEWQEVTVILEMTVTCGRGRLMEGRGWADGERVGRGAWQLTCKGSVATFAHSWLFS